MICDHEDIGICGMKYNRMKYYCLVMAAVDNNGMNYDMRIFSVFYYFTNFVSGIVPG